MSETDSEGSARPHVTSTRVTNSTHTRLKDHNRDSETLSATIDRALDALEREDALPEAVAEVLRDDA